MTKAKKPNPLNAETRAAKIVRVREITKEIRANLKTPFHSSDHNDLYGEDGLPLESGTRFDLTDIEPALKD
jgi:hypothetical protein